ncbi:MAG: thiamine phosphate synthase [Geobacter sp.]|nr:thiamine phosphate synthase [Geobacter sp.]
MPIDFDLYLITDRHQTGGRDLPTVVGEALAGGVRAVQLREKDLSSRELYELALELRKLTERHGARLIINDRIDIALAVNADGVHLGKESIPIHRARKLLGPTRLIGVSCHNQICALTAEEKGADFITFGPVFFTPSKARYGEPVGTDRLETVARQLKMPVFGLGGINLRNTPQVLNAHAHGIALISAIIAAPEPARAANDLLAAIAAVKARSPITD